jgi:hypothetical protein
MLLQKSSTAKRLIFVDWILQGSEALRSDGERASRLLGEILRSYPDPFVSKMRNTAAGKKNCELSPNRSFATELAISSPSRIRHRGDWFGAGR